MNFDTSVIGQVHVLTPTKNLVGGNETESLKAAIAEFAAAGAPKVVVDLGKIAWVSSLGIAGLLRARKCCIDEHGWFRLARLGKRIEHVVKTGGFIFDTFETVEEAAKESVKESGQS
jgi:anti-anti-sigma factor